MKWGTCPSLRLLNAHPGNIVSLLSEIALKWSACVKNEHRANKKSLNDPV
jgi:hypothetical protein